MPETDTPVIPIPEIQTTGAVPVNVPVLPCTDVLPNDTQVIEGTIIVVSEEWTPFARGDTGHIFPVVSMTLFIMAICLPSIILQLYLINSMPRVTVFLVPKEQTITTSTTFQLGRVVPPITIHQTGVTPATGRGHQYATNAHGYITFYNGEFNQVVLPAGMVVTGSDGIAVITDTSAIIPAGNPPYYGHARVAAHAISRGERGNIAGYDISVACCAPSILAKNTTAFTGGQDARDFSTVTTKDISTLAATLKQHLTQPMQAALSSQLQTNETLYPLTCRQTITPDHHAGEEATMVHVTVSETCTGIAYDVSALTKLATQTLSAIAADRLEIGYNSTGAVQTTIMSAVVHNSAVELSVRLQGMWVYQVTKLQMQLFTSLIAGKTTADALRLLQSQQGIQAITFDNLPESDRLPKNPAAIHLTVLERAG